MEVKYKIYPSLLDGFLRYLGSGDFKEEAEAKEELIKKINREPFDESPALLRGRALQSMLNAIEEETRRGVKFSPDTEVSIYDKEEVKLSMLIELNAPFKGAVQDWYCEAVMQTKYGPVLLYGIIDYLNGNTCYDLKYCENYELGRYGGGVQRLLYPYCLNADGNDIRYFEFRATDLKSIFPESYEYKAEVHEPELRNIVEQFIEFIEQHRVLLTDEKLFGGERKNSTLAS